MVVLKPTDKALLDPSRFFIYLFLLRNGPKSVSDLARELEILDAKTKEKKKLSKTAISKHCRILEEAGLLISRAEFKGKQGISKIYRATQRSKWEEFILMRRLDPKKLPDSVYEKMDELAFHPKYLKLIEEELKPDIEGISLVREKERLDQVLLEKKDRIFAKIKKDPELAPIYTQGFKKFFEFIRKI